MNTAAWRTLQSPYSKVKGVFFSPPQETDLLAAYFSNIPSLPRYVLNLLSNFSKSHRKSYWLCQFLLKLLAREMKTSNHCSQGGKGRQCFFSISSKWQHQATQKPTLLTHQLHFLPGQGRVWGDTHFM